MSVILAEPRARDLAVLEAVNHRHCWLGGFRAGGVKPSRIESPCFFLLAGDGSECGVYIARHDGDQI